MEITKLKILKLKNGNGLELSYEKPGPNTDKIAVTGETHTALIHNDLYNAIQSLGVHLAMMAFHVKENQVEDIAMPDINLFKDFTVGSYSLNGKEEKRGIIISGTLRKGGKAHNFNTPFYRFEEPESNRYAFMDDLAAKIRVIESEAGQYLAGDKIGDPVQGTLDLPDTGGKITKMKFEKPTEKVTQEGNIAPESAKHKYANKDAMERIKEDDKEEKKKKAAGKKKVQQTADTPSGEVAE